MHKYSHPDGAKATIVCVSNTTTVKMTLEEVATGKRLEMANAAGAA